jgi:hypothetical protein
MKKIALILLGSSSLLLSACAFFPYSAKVGSSESSFLRNTLSSDLVYLEGSVKAYRAGSAYYYFKDGLLVKVLPQLLSADKI